MNERPTANGGRQTAQEVHCPSEAGDPEGMGFLRKWRGGLATPWDSYHDPVSLEEATGAGAAQVFQGNSIQTKPRCHLLSSVPRYLTESNKPLLYLPLCLIALLYLALYVRYSFRAWFLSDDFLYLQQFKNCICINEVVSLGNSGRFISRNVYWYAMEHLFGMNSVCYFLVNLALLIILSWLCFLLVRQLTNSHDAGVFSGIIYFIMVPTQFNFGWISNTQHLIGHFFVLVFLLLSCNERFLADAHRLRTSLALISLFVCGLYSNIGMFAVIPSLIAYIVLFSGVSGLDKPKVTLILVLSLCSILFWTRVKGNLDAEHAAHFTFSQFVDTLFFYGTLGSKKVLGLITLAVSLLLVCATTVWFVLKRDRIGLFLIVLAGSFYIPFAFLVWQRHMNYMSLPVFFLTSSMIYLVIRYVKAPAVTYLVVLIHILFIFKTGPKSYYDQPAAGSFARTFIEELNQLDLKGYKRVCLQSLDPQPPNKTGVKFWDISESWHMIGDGDAMRLFGAVRADYLPYGATPCLNHPTVIVDKDLRIVKILFPDV